MNPPPVLVAIPTSAVTSDAAAATAPNVTPSDAAAAAAAAIADPHHEWQHMTRTVAHYQRGEQIGEGTYGQVYRAICRDTGQPVALKKMRQFAQRSSGMPLQLIREIKILKQLRHPNLLQMIEVVTSKGVEHLDPDDPITTGESSKKKKEGSKDPQEDAASLQREKYKGNLFLVLEYVTHDLTGLMDVAYQFTPVQIKSIFQQLLKALAYMHEHKYVHRDIKSSNILLDSNFRLKLADFGLARSLEPPLLDQMEQQQANSGYSNNQKDLTNKVITLWYRPPEILLGTVHYGCAVDVWSAGCILAELLTGKPLASGKTELDQLAMVADLTGTPDADTWSYLHSLKKSRSLHDAIPATAEQWREGERLPSKLRAKYGPDSKRNREIPETAVNLLEKLLEWDPRKRLTAVNALTNKYFWTQPVAPDNPAELGHIQVAADGHFHEFQTKQKRRQAKSKAEQARDEAALEGATAEEAQNVFDSTYRGIMEKVAQEGMSSTAAASAVTREPDMKKESPRRSSDRAGERTADDEKHGDKRRREGKDDRHRSKSSRSDEKEKDHHHRHSHREDKDLDGRSKRHRDDDTKRRRDDEEDRGRTKKRERGDDDDRRSRGSKERRRHSMEDRKERHSKSRDRHDDDDLSRAKFSPLHKDDRVSDRAEHRHRRRKKKRRESGGKKSDKRRSSKGASSSGDKERDDRRQRDPDRDDRRQRDPERRPDNERDKGGREGVGRGGDGWRRRDDGPPPGESHQGKMGIYGPADPMPFRDGGPPTRREDGPPPRRDSGPNDGPLAADRFGGRGGGRQQRHRDDGPPDGEIYGPSGRDRGPPHERSGNWNDSRRPGGQRQGRDEPRRGPAGDQPFERYNNDERGGFRPDGQGRGSGFDQRRERDMPPPPRGDFGPAGPRQNRDGPPQGDNRRGRDHFEGPPYRGGARDGPGRGPGGRGQDSSRRRDRR